MTRRIGMSAPDIDERDVQAVAEVVRSGRLALGPRCLDFEAAVAQRVDRRHAIAVSSGTAALHMAVRALEWGPGDEVLVPSFTFAASANAVLFEGVQPVFVDIEADTFNIDPEQIEAAVTPRTKGIVVVDVFGHPAEWQAIERIAAKHDLQIIDDCCEALGATYGNRPVGSFGRFASFGFYPNKQITTGEGGMLLTDDDALAEVARSLRNQGRNAMGAWLTHERLGYNYRLDEMSAALGASQMGRLDEILAGRAAVAKGYTRRLEAFDWLQLPGERPGTRRSWFVFVVTLEQGMQRDPLMQAMEQAGVPVRAYFDPLHQQPYMQPYLQGPVSLPVTESVAERTLALPFHAGLSDDDLDHVVAVLERSREAAYVRG